MIFKKLKAQNFLSFGKTPLEINFSNYSNVISVRGLNGSGKTSIINALVYGLYGKLIKELNHSEAINNKSKKGLSIEIEYEINGVTYKILRKREPNDLILWVDGKEEKLGGMPATQEFINKTLNLSYNAFTNITCFGQHNDKSFLKSTAGEKRNIVESLLSLDKYNKYCDVIKKQKSHHQSKIENLSTLYTKQISNIESLNKQINSIKYQKQSWEQNLKNQITKYKNEVNLYSQKIKEFNPDVVELIEKINLLEEQIKKEIKFKEELSKNVDDAQSKKEQIKELSQNCFLEIKEKQFANNKIKNQIKELESNNNDLLTMDGTKCSVCYGTISKNNYNKVIEHNNTQIDENKKNIEKLFQDIQLLQSKKDKCDINYKKLEDAIDKCKINLLKTTKSIAENERQLKSIKDQKNNTKDTNIAIYEEKINNLNEQVNEKTEELLSDPYLNIFNEVSASLEEEISTKSKTENDIQILKEDIPYFDFWIKGFGDKGLRSFLVDEIIPTLNSKIDYWMQFLVDNKFRVTFNNLLEAKIEKIPFENDEFVYSSLSGGEIQRVDLAIMHGFADVTTLTSGTTPSIIFLDEVGTNLDREGIQAVYSMIGELSRSRQVFVTTHDPDLLEMLSVNDIINVQKKDGLSEIL